ncbi:MAG TPA: hypothetical protein VFA10_07240 [Ktedonobacteraceae bacterium]|jgi:hypothetical protein|nr:hypothetical protein [Ktedonobacteraceae bacterium]
MKKRKKRAKKGELQTITKAVTHIGLEATNPGKLAAWAFGLPQRFQRT